MEQHEKLEGEIAKWAGVRNVVACSSGTAALHLALEALRLPPGSPVIVPDFCMVAVPRAVALAGLKPVFVDVDECGNLDPEVAGVASRESNAKAMIVVHTYGVPAKMKALAEIGDRDGIPIVEDLAEAHGLAPHRDSTAACWSFYRNKIVAGEEGGAVAFEVPRLADRARRLRCLGFTDDHDFWHQPRGCNYRLAPSLAEKIRAALEVRKLRESVYERWQLRNRLMEAIVLKAPKAIVFAPVAPWVFVVRLPKPNRKVLDWLVTTVRGMGVDARHGFKPCHRQPEWEGARINRARNGVEATSVVLSESMMYLPLSPGVYVSQDFAEAVAERVGEAISKSEASASA